MRRFGLILVTTTALTGLAGAAIANPTGGVVAAGSASIASSGTTLTVTQSSSKAIINWGTFNIGQNETTNFVQPSSSSIALNRISDINPSTIAGNLDANGHIILINPNGVIFSGTAHVDVAGITATTANIADADFMAGNYNFSQPGNPNGAVINQGSITVEQAGLASLVAPQVENDGVITAKLGRINLASGDTFTLDLAGDGAVQVAVRSSQLPIQKAINTGTLSANGGTVTITAAAARDVVDDLITNTGVIQADTMSGKAGSVTLYASGGRVNNSGVIYARGQNAGESGGTVSITADSVQHSGTIDVSGQAKGGTVNITAANDYSDTAASAIHADSAAGQGGSVTISAATVTTNGTITANGITGGGINISGVTVNQNAALEAIGINAGGTVNISFSQLYTDSADALITTAASNGSGGTIVVAGGDNASLYAEGSYIASGQTTGGTINLLTGQDIFLLGAFLSGEGGTQGGTVRIGGDLHGGGTLRRSQYTYIDGNTMILDSATGNGDGGEVVVWSDAATYFGGTIDATGAGSGSGGFVETSSHNVLTPDGIVNVGKGGIWLLDPADLTITTSTGAQVTSSGTNPITWATTSSATSGSDSYLNAATIDSELNAGTNVIVQTSTNGSGGSGNITVSSAISATTGTGGVTGSLTLSAYGNIIVNSSITEGSSTVTGGGVILDADNAGNHSGYIDLGYGTTLATNGGNITFGGGTLSGGLPSGSAWGNAGQNYGVYVYYSTVDASGGNISITGTGSSSGNGAGVENSGTIKTSGSGNITINATGGNGSGFANTGSTVSAVNGNISITGVGGNNASGNTAGTSLGIIKTTGTGNISVSGTGGSAGTGNYGIIGTYGGTDLVSATGGGNITITGIPGAGTTAGIFFYSGGLGANTFGGAGDTGNITFNSDAIATSNAPTIQTSGIVTFAPRTASTTVGVAGGAGTLQITSTLLNSITAGEVDVGATADTSGLTANAYTWSNSAKFITGSGSITLSGVQAMGTHNLTIESDTIPTISATPTGTGILTLMPASVGTTVGVAGGSGTLNIGTSLLSSLGNTWSGYVFGRTDETGNMTVDAYTWGGNATFETGSGVITIAGAQTMGGNNFTINSNVTPTFSAAVATTGLISVGTSSATLGVGTNATGTVNYSDTIITNDLSGGSYQFGSTTTGDVDINTGTAIASKNLTFISGGSIYLDKSGDTSPTALTDSGSSNTTLTMQAGSNIILNNAITANGTGKLNILLDSNYANANSGYINVAAGLTSNGGNITMGGGSGTITAGSGYAWGNSGQAAGIIINAATVDSGSGSIVMNGQGYTGGTNTSTAYGIEVEAGGKVQASGAGSTGAITLTGVGGGIGSGANNYGVYIASPNTSTVSVVNGNLSITGTGGGTTGGSNYGVDLLGSTMQTTGTGTIAITGYGGSNASDATGGDIGVNMNWYSAAYATFIQSTAASGGGITLIGYGGDSGGGGGSNYGLYQAQTTISSVDGNILVEGNTGNGHAVSTATGSSNDGYVSSSFGTITSTGNATITITGISAGSGSGGSNYGVASGSSITSAAGNISITGTGAPTTGNNNYGVSVTSGAIQSTGSATLTITGTGGGSGASTGNIGLDQSAGTIQSTGTGGGGITLIGYGGDTGGSGSGIGVETFSGTITSKDGAILIDGNTGTTTGQTISTATGNGNYGFEQSNFSTVSSTGNATITIAGVGAGSGASASDYGVYLNGAGGATITSATGNIAITGTGAATTGGSDYGTYQALGTIQTTGAATVTLTGTGGGSGAATDNEGMRIAGTVQSTATSGGGLTFIGYGGDSGGSGGSNYGIVVSGTVTSKDGNILIDGNTGTTTGQTVSTATGNSNAGVNLGGGTVSSTGNATITINGVGDGSGASNNDYGIFTGGTFSITSATGNIAITGIGAATTGGGDYGISEGSGNTIQTTGAATITLTGTGGGTGAATDNEGMRISGTVQSTGTSGGGLTFIGYGGDSGGSGGSNVGFVSSGTITSKDGNILIDGNTGTTTGQTVSTATGSTNYGVGLGASGVISSTGNATITLNGVGAGSGSSGSDYGVNIATSGKITSVNTAININGTGANDSGSSNYGFYLQNNGTVYTTGNGGIIFTGTGGNSATDIYSSNSSGNNQIGGASDTGGITFNANTITFANNTPIQTTGTVTFAPRTAGTSIGVAGGAGTLQITSGAGSILANTTAGEIDIGAVGDSALLTANAYTWAENAKLLSGTGGITIAGAQSMGSNTFFAETAGASDITLGASGSVISTGTGTPITLVSGRNFINNNGSGALSASNGRWLVYSTNPSNDTDNSLSNSFRRFSCTYGGSCPSFPATGNGFLYSYTPTLTATPNAIPITYGDAAPNLTGYAYTLSGYLGSDSSSDSVSGSLNGTTNYTQFANHGSYNINYSSGSLSSAMGYALSYANNTGGLTVAQKTLTASLTGTVDKTYDATTTATLAAGNYLLAGVINGDTVNLNDPASGTYDTKNVGTGKTVSVSGLSISGAGAGNYVLASTSINGAIGEIDKASLTITGVSGTNKVYDATTADAITGTATLSGVFGGDTVNLVTSGASASFLDKNVGNGKTVDFSGFTISGADSGNYSLSQPASSTANITAYGLTISGMTASNKVYDATTTATINNSGDSLVGVFGGDTVSLNTATTATFSDKNVGTGKTVTGSGFTLSGADSGNYTLTQPTATANITQAVLTITGVSANNKVYDATTSDSLTTTGDSLVGVISGDTVNLSNAGATGTFGNKNVGTGKSVTASGFTISGADAGNYSLTQPTTTANITPYGLTVTGVSGTNKVYDGTTLDAISGTATLNGVLAGDTVNLVTTGATGNFLDKNVGTGKTVDFSGYTLAGADAGNYTVTQPVNSTANITVADLTVTANNKSMAVDGTLPTLTYSYSGLATGDGSASFSGALTTSATASSPAGAYGITIGTLAATGNYDIGTFNDGTLTISTVSTPAVSTAVVARILQMPRFIIASQPVEQAPFEELSEAAANGASSVAALAPGSAGDTSGSPRKHGHTGRKCNGGSAANSQGCDAN